MPPSKRLVSLLCIAILLTAALGCIWGASPRESGEPPTRPPLAAEEIATATESPAATPSPSPMAAAAHTPTKEIDVQPDEGATSISVEMSAAEINGYLEGQSFSQSGATLSDAIVQITREEMTIGAYLQHASTGLAGDITIKGEPVLADGKLYFRTRSVNLGPQFSGLVRSIAEIAIQQALDELNEEKGIPIPLPGGIVVTSVTLGDDALLFEGLRQ